MPGDVTGSSGSPVALVTGAARGIGAQVCRTLSAQGWIVVAFDCCAGDDGSLPYPLATRAELDATVAACVGDALPVVGDVRDLDTLRAAVEQASRLGDLRAGVAAAAVMLGGRPLWETDRSLLDRLWEVDVIGVWNTATAVVPALLAAPEPRAGRFVALASAAAHVGMWHLSAYNTTKHAVAGLVRGLAADLRGTGVTACALSPGSTATAMLDATASIYGLASPDDFTGSTLLDRLIDPAEIAAAVAHACSAPGAVFNGSVVRADGGFLG